MLATPPAVAAGIDNVADLKRIRDMTPSCRSHPNAKWIGKVHGETQDAFDITYREYFEGCFDDEKSCERWKAKAGSVFIMLWRYSCKPRR